MKSRNLSIFYGENFFECTLIRLKWLTNVPALKYLDRTKFKTGSKTIDFHFLSIHLLTDLWCKKKINKNIIFDIAQSSLDPTNDESYMFLTKFWNIKSFWNQTACAKSKPGQFCLIYFRHFFYSIRWYSFHISFTFCFWRIC